MAKGSKILETLGKINTVFEVINALKADKEIRDFKKTYPIDGEILNYILSAFTQLGMGNYVNKIPQIPAFTSNRRFKKFSIQENIRAIGFVDPDIKLVEFDFIPNFFISEGLGSETRIFIGYVNEALPGIKLKLTGKSAKGWLAKESLDISFSRSLSYANLAKINKIFIQNLLRGCLEYVGSVEKAAVLMQDFKTAEQAFAAIKVSTDEKKPSPKSSPSHVDSTIEMLLVSEKYIFSKTSSSFKFTGGTIRQLTRTARITDESLIVIETQLETIDAFKDDLSKFNVYGFMDYVNTRYTLLGKLIYDRQNKCIKYLTSIDVLGVEDEVSNTLLLNLLEENAENADKLYGRIEQMISNNILFGEAYKSFENNDTIDTDVYEESLLASDQLEMQSAFRENETVIESKQPDAESRPIKYERDNQKKDKGSKISSEIISNNKANEVSRIQEVASRDSSVISENIATSSVDVLLSANQEGGNTKELDLSSDFEVTKVIAEPYNHIPESNSQLKNIQKPIASSPEFSTQKRQNSSFTYAAVALWIAIFMGLVIGGFFTGSLLYRIRVSTPVVNQDMNLVMTHAVETAMAEIYAMTPMPEDIITTTATSQGISP